MTSNYIGWHHSLSSMKSVGGCAVGTFITTEFPVTIYYHLNHTHPVILWEVFCINRKFTFLTKRIYLIYFYSNSGRWSPYRMSTRHCGHVLAYCTCPGWLWGWRSWWNEILLAGETEVLWETCPSAILSTTNPTCHTRATAVGSQRLTAWAMTRPEPRW
jgi:hypothetical protein